MARHGSITNDIDDYGRLITAAYGLDRSWHDDAACREYAIGRDWSSERNPWHVAITDKFADGVDPRELVKVAKMICYGCPSQYGCARYAVAGEVAAGTWAGLGVGDLQWLIKQEKEEPGVIELHICQALEAEMPMQDYVPEIRALMADT